MSACCVNLPYRAPILFVTLSLLIISGLLLTTPWLILPPVFAAWAVGLRWHGVSSKWMNAAALLAGLLLMEWVAFSLMAVFQLTLLRLGKSVSDCFAWAAIA